MLVRGHGAVVDLIGLRSLHFRCPFLRDQFQIQIANTGLGSGSFASFDVPKSGFIYSFPLTNRTPCSAKIASVPIGRGKPILLSSTLYATTVAGWLP